MRDGSVRGFSIGVAALREDLGVDRPPGGWAGSASDLERAARLSQGLAVRQAGAGQLEAARAGIESVARIYRRLLPSAPARYRPELAVTLTAWGLWSSRLGHHDEAARVLEEAEVLYRDHLATRTRLRVMLRIRLWTGLAVTLSNLGVVRSELGRHESATDAASEAVAVLRRLRERNPLYRMLARGDPVAFEHCLAAALNNLGLVLAARGEGERACAIAVETAAGYRRLAELAPVVFEAEVARVLHNLALAAADVGELDTALAASDEAVRRHRELPAVDPTGLHRDLARALCGFARVRLALGADPHADQGAGLHAGLHADLGAARAAADEAVELLERLGTDTPEFSADLHAAYLLAARLRSGPPGGAATRRTDAAPEP